MTIRLTLAIVLLIAWLILIIKNFWTGVEIIWLLAQLSGVALSILMIYQEVNKNEKN